MHGTRTIENFARGPRPPRILVTFLFASLGCGGDPAPRAEVADDPEPERDLPADSFDDEPEPEPEAEPEEVERGTGALCPDEQTLTWEGFGQGFMEEYCLSCHSGDLVGAARHDAPVGMDFDTVELVRAHAARIDVRSGIGPDAANRTMPNGGLQPTEQERRDLAEWLACGAPETECDLPGADCVPESEIPCDEGDQNQVDPVTGHCYMLFSSGATWEDARRRCEALGDGAKLVTIQSADENGVVADLVDAERVWLGASDRSQERAWTWITGEPLASTYSYWEGGGPDGGDAEDCVEMLGAALARWNDDDCDDERAYVCERGEECLCDVTDLCDGDCSCDAECDHAGGCACDVSSECDDCWCEPVDDCPVQREEREDEPEQCDDCWCDCDWTWGACDLFGNDWDGWVECGCDPDCWG